MKFDKVLLKRCSSDTRCYFVGVAHANMQINDHDCSVSHRWTSDMSPSRCCRVLPGYPLSFVKSLQLIWRSGTRLRLPDLQMSCSDLTERSGTKNGHQSNMPHCCFIQKQDMEPYIAGVGINCYDRNRTILFILYFYSLSIYFLVGLNGVIFI